MRLPASHTPQRFGNFVLLSSLGVGGMAEVFRAKAIGAAGFQKDVALKRILPAMARDEHFISMFVDEAKIMVSLNHPNIVQVFELGQLDGHYFIAMEFVQGRDLLDLLATSVRIGYPLPMAVALSLVIDVLHGLHCAHEATDAFGRPLGVVHRDVSPSNVLIGYDGRTRLGDFGIAKSSVQSHRTEVGTQKGKTGYMSAEQVRGESIDRRSDIFAAGVLLYETLTLSRLFASSSDFDVLLRIRNADIDEAIEAHPDVLDETLIDILRHAITRSPQTRYPTAALMARELEDYAAERGIALGPPVIAQTMRVLFAEQMREALEERQHDGRAVHVALHPRDPVYRVRLSPTEELGPLSYEDLLNMLDKRPLPEDALLRYREEPWLSPAAFPEIADYQGASRSPLLSADDLADLDIGDSLFSREWEATGQQTRQMDDFPPPSHTSVPTATEEGTSFRQASGVGLTPQAVQAAVPAAPPRGPQTPPPATPSAFETPAASTPGAPPSAGSAPASSPEAAPAAPPPEEAAPAPDPSQPHFFSLPLRTGQELAQGALGALTPMRLLSFLHREQFHGVLRMESAPVHREIFFQHGNPEHASALSEEELLGHFLLRLGKINPAQLQRALDALPQAPGRLGDVLVFQGSVSPHDISEAVRLQLVERMTQLLAWGTGQWTLYPPPAEGARYLPQRLPFYPTMMQSLRANVSRQTLEFFFSPLLQGRLELGTHGVPSDTLPWQPRQLRFARKAAPGMTVHQALHAMEARNEDEQLTALEVLYLLTQLGSLDIHHPAHRPQLPRLRA